MKVSFASEGKEYGPSFSFFSHQGKAQEQLQSTGYSENESEKRRWRSVTNQVKARRSRSTYERIIGAKKA